jgi:hypothetical protein
MKRTLALLALVAGACGEVETVYKQEPEAIAPVDNRVIPASIKEPGEGWKSTMMTDEAALTLRKTETDPPAMTPAGWYAQVMFYGPDYIVNNCGSYREPGSGGAIVVFSSGDYGGGCAEMKFSTDYGLQEFFNGPTWWVAPYPNTWNDNVRSWKARARSNSYYRIIYQRHQAHFGGDRLEFFIPPGWVWGQTTMGMPDASSILTSVTGQPI